ncbi:MAG: hypothetical protein JXA52_02790 [Planctomycetes bacterium]|nr:hypothetical protein [Planctomycetota bacterium]
MSTGASGQSLVVNLNSERDELDNLCKQLEKIAVATRKVFMEVRALAREERRREEIYSNKIKEVNKDLTYTIRPPGIKATVLRDLGIALRESQEKAKHCEQQAEALDKIIKTLCKAKARLQEYGGLEVDLHSGGKREASRVTIIDQSWRELGRTKELRDEFSTLFPRNLLDALPFETIKAARETLNQLRQGNSRLLPKVKKGEELGFVMADSFPKPINWKAFWDHPGKIEPESLFEDAEGYVIFYYWLYGDGGEINLSNEHWSNYMRNNAFIRSFTHDFILEDDARVRDKSGGIDIVQEMIIEDGYNSGYKLLHGTSNFKIKGNVLVTGNRKSGAKFEYDLIFYWEDIIDPKFTSKRVSHFGIPAINLSDIALATPLKAIGTPQDYNISIEWRVTPTLTVQGNKCLNKSGYPLKTFPRELLNGRIHRFFFMLVRNIQNAIEV